MQVEKNMDWRGRGTDIAVGRNAFALGTRKDYDWIEMRMADPRYLMFLMEKIRDGSAEEREAYALVMRVAKLAPKPLRRLMEERGEDNVGEFAALVCKGHNRRVINDLTRIVIGIVSEMVLPDYLRK